MALWHLLKEEPVMSHCNDFKIPQPDRESPNLIYYINGARELVGTNQSFAAFAASNGSPMLHESALGKDVLLNLSGVHKSRWKAIYGELLSGRLPQHSERFQCPSPLQRREFLMSVERVTVDGELLLRHETTLLATPVVDLTGKPHEQEGNEGRAFRFAICERPMEAESGDGAWVRKLGEGREAVMIADAMGHGPGAAAALRQFFQYIAADPLTDPRQAIVDANNKYTALPGHEVGATPFITGLLMTVDTNLNTMDIVCFGHHGMIFTPSGPIEVPGGLPVGILEGNTDWSVVSLDLNVLGPRALAYTDGIVEQFNGSGEMYGLDQLARDFSETATMPLAASLSAMLRRVDQFRKGALVKDDQTLLAMEVRDWSSEKGMLPRHAGSVVPPSDAPSSGPVGSLSEGIGKDSSAGAVSGPDAARERLCAVS
jgi:hypothetical protein